MGRLTEYFKFINCPPDRFCGLWIKENMTSLSVTPEIKKLRSLNLSIKRSDLKQQENKELKERFKKSKAVEYFSDLEAMELGLITKSDFENKHGSIL